MFYWLYLTFASTEYVPVLNLLKYQKAYEANARFFRAIDTTLDTLLGILR